MWKKNEEVKSHAAEAPVRGSSVSSGAVSATASKPDLSVPVSVKASACISQGIRIKGEVSGSEDLFVDGHVEGKLNLSDTCCVTIGPHGEVKADISAREVIVRGRVDGKIFGREKIELWSTANIAGDLRTERHPHVAADWAARVRQTDLVDHSAVEPHKCSAHLRTLRRGLQRHTFAAPR